MRWAIAATMMIAATTAPAHAQTPAQPAPAKQVPAKQAPAKQAPVTQIKPKPVATVPVRPATQTPADTANAMAQSERLSIQSDLAWIGVYNGVINGEVSDRMIAAIRAFQKDQGAKQTGVLNPQERGVLTAAAKKLQDNVGWKLVTDPGTGARLGVPTKLAPQTTSDATGTRWNAVQGTIQIALTRRKEAGATIAAAAEREKKEPPGRKADYSVVRPDFFVLSGLQGLKKFYLRGQLRGDEIRILTILYDQATEGTMAPVVIAMSSAFTPFPNGAPAEAASPAPRKKVEYATGIVVSVDGAIATDRQSVDGCQFIVIPGYGNADRIAEDKTSDLALLRVYGARDLKPLPVAANGVAKPDLTVTGIADPQNQGGAARVSAIPAKMTPGDNAVSPAPGLGFSGAAAIDSDGKFAGMVQLRQAVLAGPVAAAPVSQATLVGGKAVADFLAANKINSMSGAADAKASVLRVICVRK